MDKNKTCCIGETMLIWLKQSVKIIVIPIILVVKICLCIGFQISLKDGLNTNEHIIMRENFILQ